MLLNVFYLYLPISLPVYEDIDYVMYDWKPHQERSWYKLAHVCQRWRFLKLASASYLRLSLLCTYRNPVEDMLAHSPPLPLTIDYVDKYEDVTTEDEEGILLALEHRDRVHSIRLRMPVPSLRKTTEAIGNEFAILEFLIIKPLTERITSLVSPRSFRAPHLRHLVLSSFAFPMVSPLHATAQAVNLVTFILGNIPQSAHSHPNDLSQILLHIPQLEMLGIYFHSLVPSPDPDDQLLYSPVITPITLPNLRNFMFEGTSAYLEALLPHITTPLLETLYIEFFPELYFSLPHLQQFISTLEHFRFSSATLTFSDYLSLSVRPYGVARLALDIEVEEVYLNRQVTSAVGIINSLRIPLSSVEDLTLADSNRNYASPEWTRWVYRSLCRALLRPFSNLKKLRVRGDPIPGLLYFLEAEDGESPIELLPKLQELSHIPYPESGDDRDAYTKFIDYRQNAGHTVALIYK